MKSDYLKKLERAQSRHGLSARRKVPLEFWLKTAKNNLVSKYGAVRRQCEIPFCSNHASHIYKVGNRNHYFCEKHFERAIIPPEMKRKIDGEWFTEERKRRIFDPTSARLP